MPTSSGTWWLLCGVHGHHSDAMLYSSLRLHGKTKGHGSRPQDKDSGPRVLGIKCLQGRVVGDSEGKQNSSHVGADYTESSGEPERSPSQGGRQWAATVVPTTQWLSFPISVPTLSSLKACLRMKNHTRSAGLGVGKHKQSKGVCLPLPSYRGHKRRCLKRAGKQTVNGCQLGVLLRSLWL